MTPTPMAFARQAMGLTVVLVACAFGWPALAQEAGRFEFVTGETLVRSPSGVARPALRGGAIGQGETVETSEGRAQLRMVDGAYLSLQPRTALRFDEYAPPREGTEERGIMHLLRGGLRTITGTIGRINRPAYRVSTPTATIGIRGTQFALVEGEGTRVNVADGIVQLCTAGGCLDVHAGQSGFTPGPTTRPSLAFAPARLPPVAALQQVQPLALSDSRRADGAAVVFDTALAGASAMPVVPLPSGPGGIAMATTDLGGAFSAGLLGGTVTFAGSGALSQFIDGSTPANNFTAGVSSDFGADGIIAWGRWTTGDRAGVQQLTMSYAANLSSNVVTTSSIVRAYATFASTAPTVTAGGAIVATGAQNSVTGTMNVNFANLTGGGTLSYLLNVPVAGQTFSINGAATQFVGTAFLGSSSTITSTGAGCTPSCTGNLPFANAIQGFFTGPNAERAGANYGFASQVGQVSGAVVFR